MTKSLRIGYVPLTDAALLHVAKAQNFAAARGVEIELVADSSRANIRDKLVAGHWMRRTCWRRPPLRSR